MGVHSQVVKILLVKPSTLALYENNKLDIEKAIRDYFAAFDHKATEAVQQTAENPQHH